MCVLWLVLTRRLHDCYVLTGCQIEKWNLNFLGRLSPKAMGPEVIQSLDIFASLIFTTSSEQLSVHNDATNSIKKKACWNSHVLHSSITPPVRAKEEQNTCHHCTLWHKRFKILFVTVHVSHLDVSDTHLILYL